MISARMESSTGTLLIGFLSEPKLSVYGWGGKVLEHVGCLPITVESLHSSDLWNGPSYAYECSLLNS